MQRFTLRIALGFSAIIAAGVMVSAVMIFLGRLAYHGLVGALSPAAAAVIVSMIGLAAAAGLVAGGIRLLCRLSPRRPSQFASGENHLAKQLEALVGAEFVSLIENHPRASAASALLAGLVVGARPNLRKSLRELL